MATNWITNYMVAQVTPPGITNLGYKFWTIWAVVCASFVPITDFSTRRRQTVRSRTSIATLLSIATSLCVRGQGCHAAEEAGEAGTDG